MFEEIRKRYKKEGSIHHAYLLVFPEVGEGRRITEEGIVSLGVSIIGNPDYLLWTGQTFGIDDARALKESESKRGVSGKRWFVIQAGYFTEEAQNALLKVFEDPSGDSHFFIIAEREEVFLPTLRSRMAIISQRGEEEKTKNAYATFFKKTPGERLKMIEEILNDEEENVRGKALAFLNDIEVVLNESVKKEKKIRGDDLKDIHEAIVNARRFISKNQGSKKLLLEYIALTAPVSN